VTRYHLPAELALAGCSVILLPTSDASPTELKRFRAHLADLVRAGLPREEALKAVTQYPAEALGMADRFGTIEKGKEADLIFLDGDPLDPHTRVTRVMMHGEIVWEAPQRP
jgi:imidazolonepropionase-like amidohydrolase